MARSAGGKPIDWERAKQRYVTAEDAVTLAAIAEELGVNAANVRARASREGWRMERQQYRNSRATLATRKQLELDADDLALELHECGKSWGRVGRRLLALIELRIAPEGMTAEQVSCTITPANAAVLHKLIASAAVATEKQRLIAGLPTERTDSNISMVGGNDHSIATLDEAGIDRLICSFATIVSSEGDRSPTMDEGLSGEGGE
jgi:hypothetical protein